MKKTKMIYLTKIIYKINTKNGERYCCTRLKSAVRPKPCFDHNVFKHILCNIIANVIIPLYLQRMQQKVSISLGGIKKSFKLYTIIQT